MLATTALATNGDNMMAIGPNARAMGGVGVAAPQDAISAVFANPAAMCFTPGCAYSEVNFAGTLFMPHPKAELDLQGDRRYVPPHQRRLLSANRPSAYCGRLLRALCGWTNHLHLSSR